MRAKHFLQSVLLACSMVILANSAVEPCREYFVHCTSMGKMLDNCNMAKYIQYLSLTVTANLDSHERRKSKSAMKSHFQGMTEDCYIEAVVSRLGQLLFIRFSKQRSILTASTLSASSNLGLRHFKKWQERHEKTTNGMQMMVEMDATQVCHQLWVPSSSASNPKMKFTARFAKRSSIAYVPMMRYKLHTFESLTFHVPFLEVVTAQQAVAAVNGLGSNFTKVLDLAKREPLILWVYKCPAKMGLHDNMPCNSEVNLYIYLRQWINNTVMMPNDGDYFDNYGWRYLCLTSDYFVLIVVGVTAVYVAIHLTCVTWLGLIPSGKIG